MYRCYWLKSEMSSKNVQFLFRCYVSVMFLMYLRITLVLLFFLTITYDWRTGNGKNTMLPNGHCSPLDQYDHNSSFLKQVIIITNKFAQIAMFLVYLVYFYKLKADFCDAPNSVQYNRKLFWIAIAMGVTIGLSHFFWVLIALDPGYSFLVVISGGILLFIQQVVIMTFFMCTRRIAELCKACFSREQD